MQCRKCGSKWETKTEVTNCPFCGQSLQTEKKSHEIGISDVIAHIISIRGNEVLKNSKVVTSYVMDLVQGHEREKKLFRVLCNYDIFVGAYKIVITTDPQQRDILIKRQYKILTDEAFLPGEVALDALNIVLRGIGVSELKSKDEKPITKHTTESLPKTESIQKTNTPPISSIPRVSSPNKPLTRNTQAIDTINTFSKYQKALEEYYVRLGKQPLSETQIRQFLIVNHLDRNWGITIEDVQKDLKDIYAKYTVVKKPTQEVVKKASLFTPNKRLSNYKTYMDELEQVFIRNGKTMLSKTQIFDFIEAYSLNRNFGITSLEVETDLREIMRRY